MSILGPSGAIGASSVSELTASSYRVSFPAFTERGDYQIAVGPDIADQSGHLMDQDQDGTAGDPTSDVFKSTLVYANADVILSSATTITESDTSYDGHDILIEGATVAIDGPHNLNSVQLINGAVLTHSADTTTTTHELDLTVAQQVVVDVTSRIDVTVEGYLAGHTTGNTMAGGATGDGGGSYGGVGGFFKGATNATYGDYADPDEPGAGSGDEPGGGLIRIQAQTVQLQGQIVADGSPGQDQLGDYPGGAGGGIYLDVDALSGTGTIVASGGAGDADTTGTFFASGAGGKGASARRECDQSEAEPVSTRSPAARCPQSCSRVSTTR